MAAQKPFLFDKNDFDEVAAMNALPPEQRPQFNKLELEQAVQNAAARSFEEGMASAVQSQEAQFVDLAHQMLTEMNQLFEAEGQRRVAAEQLAIDLAAGLLRKIMPELAGEQSLEGVSALIKKVMMDRFEEPRLIIRVHDSVVDAISERLDRLAKESGFRGQYALMADTALSPPDCRIEWSNGGVERSVARLWDQLDITLAQIKAGRVEELKQPSAATVAPLSTDNQGENHE